MKFTVKKLIAATIAIIASTTIQAQPKALEWKIMPEVVFNGPIGKSASREQKMALGIWQREIMATPSAGGRQLPAFILLGTAAFDDYTYVFSMFNAANSKCQDPPNGDGTATAQPLYAKCPMRVISHNRKTGKQNFQDVPGFCYLNLDDAPGGLRGNHTQIAFDKPNKTVYFRTVMYGKHAPECDKSMKLK